MNTGIIGYGVALPAFRITTEAIAQAWHSDAARIQASLNITEKTVGDVDEDAATLSMMAAWRALQSAKVDSQNVQAIYIGSESHPYAVKPTSTIVANAIGMGSDYFAVDLQFACKAGTAAVQIVHGLLGSEQIEYGFAIGADTAQGAPGDALEYTAGSGAVALLLGRQPKRIIAQLDATVSFQSDTPDFWRTTRAKYPEHAGRFTGEPAYYQHVIGATKLLLKKTKTAITDYNHVVFHMPNGSFPKRAAKKLGATTQQIQAGLVVPQVGNFYSASSMIGLASVLDQAKPGQRILMTSYGSGSGSDSFAFTITNAIKRYRPVSTVQALIAQRETISYTDYLVMRNKIERS